MTSKEIVQHRWHHKGRLVSMKNNLLQLVETSQSITDCERLQICRLVKDFRKVLDRFPERTAELVLETSNNTENH